MMSKTIPPYTPEFRRQMVELARSGRNPESLTKEFEPPAQTIRNWVAQMDRDEWRRADGVSDSNPGATISSQIVVAGSRNPFHWR